MKLKPAFERPLKILLYGRPLIRVIQLSEIFARPFAVRTTVDFELVPRKSQHISGGKCNLPLNRGIISR